MEETYSIAVIMTALYVDMSVSFCLPHAVAVSVSSFYNLWRFVGVY